MAHPPASDFARSDFTRLGPLSWDEQFVRYRCPECGESQMLVTAHVGYWMSVVETLDDLSGAVESRMQEDLGRHRGRCPCGKALARKDCNSLWYCTYLPALDGDLQVEFDPSPQPPAVRRFTLLGRDGLRRELGAALPPDVSRAVFEGDTWTDLMRLGVSYFMQGHSKSAVESFKDATEKDPANPRGFAWLGRAHEQEGDDAGAERSYREAIRLDPPDAEVRFGLAQAVMAQERFDEAAGLYREALERGLDDASAALAHANLGNALSEKGQLEEAAREWETAIECDEQCGIAHYNLGVYHERAGRLEQAIACFETYLDLERDAEDAEGLRGHVDDLRRRTGPGTA